MDVGILGGSGYGGGELVRLLQAHPSLKLRTVAARARAGQRLGEVFENLAASPSGHMRLAAPEPGAFEGCDLVFLATPADASRAVAAALLDAGALVVDLSDAFRLVAEPLRAPAEAAGHEPGHAAPAPAAYVIPEL